jgi:hypothetical protein
MKYLTKFAWIAVLVLFAASLTAVAGDDKWFDMENCEFCKQLMDPPEMLMHTSWEHHNIANGIVSVATVDKEYLDSWRAAEARMEEVGKRMEKGEQVPMCNSCMALGKIMMMGAKYESFPTAHGNVSLITSDDPKMVEEIQAWGKRTTDEMAKMEGMEHEHGHEQ